MIPESRLDSLIPTVIPVVVTMIWNSCGPLDLCALPKVKQLDTIWLDSSTIYGTLKVAIELRSVPVAIFVQGCFPRCIWGSKILAIFWI